jgi:hypothetical protein
LGILEHELGLGEGSDRTSDALPNFEVDGRPLARAPFLLGDFEVVVRTLRILQRAVPSPVDGASRREAHRLVVRAQAVLDGIAGSRSSDPASVHDISPAIGRLAVVARAVGLTPDRLMAPAPGNASSRGE